jgi:hypothetical protein
VADVYFGVVLPEGNGVLVQPIVAPEAIGLAPGNAGSLALISQEPGEAVERTFVEEVIVGAEEIGHGGRWLGCAGADSSGKALEQLHVGDRVSEFVGKVGGDELPGSTLGERTDKSPKEPREVVFEMAVLGCVIGELGDGYLALPPTPVERVVE